jgi:hypothetical protein
MGILFTGIVPEPFQGVYENIGGKSSRFRDNDGSSNAPATFQRLMDKVLRGLTWHQCLVYIDDVLIFAKSFKAHLVNLDFSALTRIKAAGLKLKPSKCKFGDNRGWIIWGFRFRTKVYNRRERKLRRCLRSPPSETRTRRYSVFCCL